MRANIVWVAQALEGAAQLQQSNAQLGERSGDVAGAMEGVEQAQARLSSSPLFPQWHPRSQSKPHIHG